MPIRIILLTLLVLIAGCSALSGNKKENEQILNRLNIETVEVAAPTLMMQAAAEGDSSLLKKAFAQGESLNAVSAQGTAFSLALKNGHKTIAKILLAAGADWRKGFDVNDSSALIEAASRGFNKVLKMLLIREAEVSHLDQLGYSALARAAINGHLTTMKILLHAGADVDVTPEGRSLLMHTVEDNNMLIAQQLIAAGAEVNFRDENDDTALKIARRNGYFDLDLMLVQAGARP